MKTATFGKTGLQVSRLAFGTWAFGGDWGRFDEGAAIAMIRRARDLGINFFDTAQQYGFGASERILGKALGTDLARARDELVIATKGGLRPTDSGLVRDASPEWLRKGVDSSLSALGTDHIDLYLVHWPDPVIPTSETAGALGDLLSEGKIRHAGVSNYDISLSATLPVETVQPPYHLFRRHIEDELLPYCRAHNVGVMVYGTLAHGLLTGTVNPDTSFAAEDWRSKSDVFSGDVFLRICKSSRSLSVWPPTLVSRSAGWPSHGPLRSRVCTLPLSARNISAISRTVPARLTSRCRTRTLPKSSRLWLRRHRRAARTPK